MAVCEPKNTERKRAPTLYTRSRSASSSFCRITGKSLSMDEHHYVFSSDSYPKFENVHGCRITEKQRPFKDYKPTYPVLDVDGVTRMVTENDFHCRITAKYRAMAGHRYLYPVLGVQTDHTAARDMASVLEEEAMQDVLLPHEVELMVRSGIRDVLRLGESEHLFILSNEGALFPAALKEIVKKKATPLSRRPRRHTLPIHLEAPIPNELSCNPTVKFLKDLKAPPSAVEVDPSGMSPFDTIATGTEVLKDPRKSRPKRPGRSRNVENENTDRKKRRKEATPPHTTRNVNAERSVSPLNSDPTERHLEAETSIPAGGTQHRLSRLDRYKMQFQSFDETRGHNSTGSRLTLVGAFNEEEIEELDFSEPTEIRFTESRTLLPNHAILIHNMVAEADDSRLEDASGDPVTSRSPSTEECSGTVASAQSSPTDTLQGLKSCMDSKLNFGKTPQNRSGEPYLSENRTGRGTACGNEEYTPSEDLLSVTGDRGRRDEARKTVTVPDYTGDYVHSLSDRQSEAVVDLHGNPFETECFQEEMEKGVSEKDPCSVRCEFSSSTLIGAPAHPTTDKSLDGEISVEKFLPDVKGKSVEKEKVGEEYWEGKCTVNGYGPHFGILCLGGGVGDCARLPLVGSSRRWLLVLEGNVGVLLWTGTWYVSFWRE